MGIGFTAGYHFSNFYFVGVTSDFRTEGQYSDIVSTVGDLNGNRWNIVSPTVGVRWEKLVLKLDAQLFGDYRISHSSGLGEAITYMHPFGGRLVALYPMVDKIHVGAQYEMVTYGRKASSLTGESDLTPRAAIWQVSLTAGFIF